MRTKSRSSRKKIIILAISLIVIISVPFVFLTQITARYEATIDFAFDTPPNDATFLEADEALLESIVLELSARYPEYHIPLNQSASAVFHNDSAEHGGEISYMNVSHWRHSDNHALWTGIDFTGWTYKYLVAIQEGNETMAEFAEYVLIRLTTGFSYMMKVPNGGLGPEYGGILARGYAPPDTENIWPQIFGDRFKHTNGTGEYSQWRYRGYTSNDEFAGYYLFLALATRYLMHIEYIQERVSLIVDQICYNMLQNIFHGVHTTGSTTGVSQLPTLLSGGFWAALSLKLGSIHHPEKYLSYYHHYVSNDLIYLANAESGRQNILGGYYPYNFGTCVVLAFLLLEDPSTNIWQHYFQGYLDTLWSNTRYHRNAWFNVAFLMICHENGLLEEDLNEDFDFISRDIKDQLQRFVNHHDPLPIYRRATLPHPEDVELFNPVERLEEELNLPKPVMDFLDIIGLRTERQLAERPLTLEYHETHRWVWEKNPFQYRERSEDRFRTESGAVLTVPYWMMRYLGYFGGDV